MVIHIVAVTILLLISFFTVASPVTVTVTEKISGQVDSIIRQNARIKAQYAGIERLPVVMTGYEQLTDESFKTNIKAYLVGEVDVITMSEIWNRDVGLYTLTAKVSLNRQASLEMIDGIRNNLVLQQKLKDLYSALDQLAQDKGIASSDFSDVYDRIMSVKGGALIRDSIASSIAARKDHIANSYRYYNERYMQPWINMVNLKVTSVDVSKVYYSVSVNKNAKMAEEMEAYWGSEPERKASYIKKKPAICLPGGKVLYQPPKYTVNLDVSLEHLDDERFITEPNKVLYPVLCYLKF